MQNKKIIIFGDSFADNTHWGRNTPKGNIHQKQAQTIAWHEYLEKDYDITNHGKSGTGPHYSFKEYYNFISDNEIRKEDYILIFLLSGEDRIHFPNIGPEDMNHVCWDFDKKKSLWVECESAGEQKAYYNFYRNEIDFMFLTMHDELIWSNFKNLGFLYMNSLLLNMKTIVFNTFGIKGLSDMGLNIAKLNNPNFYIYPIELGKIAHEEFIDRHHDPEGYDYTDHRRNHFSQENHTILYENMKKFIKNDYNPIPFVKNIDYSYNFGKKRDTKTGKFIYE